VTLQKFVELLRPMLKNPNAVETADGVIYIFTANREIVALDTKEQ
jgi:hypothetical protein